MIKSNIIKEFHCDIEKIWEFVTDNKKNHWRSDLLKIEIIDDLHFIEYSKKNFPTYFTITTKKKCKEYQIEFENTNLKGKWIGIFKEKANGKIELNFTENIETNNILIKILAKPYLKKQQKRYLKDLEKIINKEKNHD